MHIKLRRLIFVIFVGIFLVAAPLVVLYTAGFRLNISNHQLQQTGVLAINTFPRGSTIVLNGRGLAQKTPFVVQRLMPNLHAITLQKKGYHDWSQRINVEAGKTAYVTARLFANSQPVTLNSQESTLALRSRKGRIELPPDQASLSLFDNGANIEVRSGPQTSDGTSHTLIGLLPLGDYEILEEDDNYILLVDTQQQAFVIGRQGGAVVELPTRLTTYDWLDNEDLLIWTDGTEVNIYAAESGERTFITREGQSVVDVAWHPAADSLFVATGTSLTTYDRVVYETRGTTTLLSDSSLVDIWLDAPGKNLYYLETPFSANLPLVVHKLQLVL